MLPISQSSLIFAPRYNVKRADATGAFQPEARRFRAHHDLPGSALILIDNHATDGAMRRAVLAATARTMPSIGITVVAFFCHGTRSRIQLGFRAADVATLAGACARLGASDVHVALYACSTGSGPGIDGDGGFADRLRDALCREGAVRCSVLAHVTAGHTARNPFVRIFDGAGSEEGGTGGYMPIKQSDPRWARWVEALRDPADTLRYDLPLMTQTNFAEWK